MGRKKVWQMKLSAAQCEFLFDHIEAETVRPLLQRPNEQHTALALHGLGLIKITPDGTVLTPYGREVRAIWLGRFADALVRARYNFERLNSAPANVPDVAIAIELSDDDDDATFYPR
jgi:hypothetical protein